MMNNMRIKMMWLAAMLTAVFTAAAQERGQENEPQPSATIKFAERIHDFGKIKEADGLVSHEFEFTNTGSKPVTLLYARSGCVCVNGEVPRKPIAPGAKGKVTVTFNPLYRPGEFSKEVLVMNSDREYSRIWVKGTVEGMKHSVSENYPYEYGEGLWMNLAVMSFGRMEQGESKSVRLRLANDSDKVMHLSFKADESGLPDGARLTIPQSFILQPGDTADMKVTMQVTRKVTGEHMVKVYPVIDGIRRPQALDVKVFGK